MSVELPTEEDVLAALLVRWMIVSPSVPDVPLWAWADVPAVVRMISGHGTDPEVVERAIADSERRLKAERAERAVLAAAERWERSETIGEAQAAVDVLADAVRALRKARAVSP